MHAIVLMVLLMCVGLTIIRDVWLMAVYRQLFEYSIIVRDAWGLTQIIVAIIL